MLKNRCGVVFPIDSFMYWCRTCSVDESATLCESCFMNGNHAGHDFQKEKKETIDDQWYCDCGNDAMFEKGHIHCMLHKPMNG